MEAGGLKSGGESRGRTARVTIVVVILSFLAIANAAEGDVPVGWNVGRGRVEVLGGAELSPTGGSDALVQNALGGSGAIQRGPWSSWAGGQAELDVLPGRPLVRDYAGLEAGVAYDLRVSPGLSVRAGGSAFSSTRADVLAGPRLGYEVARFWVAAGVAGGGRSELGLRPGQAEAWVRAGGPIGPVEVGVEAAGARYSGTVAPGDVRGEVWLWTARGLWRGSAWTRVDRTFGDPAVHAGISGLVPDSVEVMSGVAASRAVGDGLWLRVEVQSELGAGSLDHRVVRPVAGLEYRRQGVHETHPDRPALVVEAPSEADVRVMGEFTGWVEVGLLFSEGRWIYDQELAPGLYEYVVLVDGEIVLPEGPTRPDGFGGENAVLVVP